MFVSLALHLPREAISVTEARHMGAVTLASLGVDQEEADAILLALTEACANVIDHATAGHSYDVTLTVDRQTCVIRVTEVADETASPDETVSADDGGPDHDSTRPPGEAPWTATTRLFAVGEGAGTPVDTAHPVDTAAPMDGAQPVDVDALLPSGRGLALMAALMDSLRFRPVPGGTSVELVKELRRPPTRSATLAD